jgi:hypothetical protein
MPHFSPRFHDPVDRKINNNTIWMRCRCTDADVLKSAHTHIAP